VLIDAKKSHAEGCWMGTNHEDLRNSIFPKLPTGGVLTWPIFAARVEHYIIQWPGKMSTRKNFLSFLNAKKGMKSWTGSFSAFNHPESTPQFVVAVDRLT